MRMTLLVLPLICLAGCTSDTGRSTPVAPAQPQAPTVAAPAVATPAVATPTVATPAVATPAVAAPAVIAPKPTAPTVAAQPAPTPVAADLAKFTGPTESAENFGFDEGAGRIFLYSGGAIVLPLKLSTDGDYEIAISAACDEANGQKAKFSVTLDGQAIGAEITCTVVDAKEYTIKAPGLKAGEHKIAIAFLNDIYKENEYDLNFFVHGVTLRPAK